VWGDASGEVCGARLSPAGAVLDTGITISDGGAVTSWPAIAFDGFNFLVAWVHGSDIRAARVTQSGQVLDRPSLAVSTAPRNQTHPAVSFDGADFLVVWEDSRNDSFSRIFGARVHPDGQVLDTSGIDISAGPDRETYPSVAYDGFKSVVVWTDYRDGRYADFHGAAVSSGTVIDRFPVVTNGGPRWISALAPGPGGQLFLAYDGWAGKEQGKSYYNGRIWGQLGRLGGIADRATSPAWFAAPIPTVVRGMLVLPQASSIKPQASSCLLDISGRTVLHLKPGPNDVSRLAPGVYFISQRSADSGERSATRKVVIQR